MREDQLTATCKKYIEVQYTEESQDYLRKYCVDNGFDLSVSFSGVDQPIQAYDFHTTVWYTSNKASVANGTQEVQISDITPKGFALFGEDENILVLEIESPDLSTIRTTMGTQYELEDEWPEYRPHITMSYTYSGELPDIDLPDGEQLVADTLNVKDQK
jgi:hypothetical protein